MRGRIVWSIFTKEVVDTLRDRRTLFAMFVIPVLLYPILFALLGRLTAGAEAQKRAMRPTVLVLGELPEPARAALAAEFGPELTVRSASADPAAEARAALDAKRFDLVVAAPLDLGARFAADEGVTLPAWFNQVQTRSAVARDRARQALEKASRAERDARLRRHHLPASFDRPFDLEAHDLAGKARRGGEMAGHVLPFILIFVMVLGGLLPAIDITAGEKERGTLQTLLTAPVRPVEIVAGKYLTVFTLSLVGAAANLGAMGVTLHQQVAALGKDGVEFNLGLGTALTVFAAMLPCALLFSAVLLALSVFARSFREANAYLSPVLMALSFPAIVALSPTAELDATTAFAPVVNLALLIRELLRGAVPLRLYFAVIVANLVYATLAVLLAARVFETEQVLLGGERPWRDLFGDSRRARVTPSPRQAVFFVAVLIVMTWYGSLFLAQYGVTGVRALLAMEGAILLAPAIGFVLASRLDMRETFLLRLPSRRALLGAVFLAGGAWAVGAAVQRVEISLFPGARAYYELFEKALRDIDAPLGLSIVAVALAPAIGEESCFRGLVLSGFANTGSRALALFGSAALFGAFHLDPYHAIGAGVLGIVFGYAALESGSIVPGMLAHMVNNGLAIVLLRHPGLAHHLDGLGPIAAGCASAALGLWLIRGTPPTARSGATASMGSSAAAA